MATTTDALSNAFQRIFGGPTFFGTDADKGSSAVSDWVRFHFFEVRALVYLRGTLEYWLT